MPTRDRFAPVRAMMRADRFAATSGMRLVELGEGRARTRMRIRPEHLNGAGVVQGGAIFTLADLAFAAACNSHGTVALALDVSITFARAATGGTLTADAREVALSRKVSVVNVEVRDGKGELVAVFRGTAYRKEEAVASLALPRGAVRSSPPRGAGERGGEGVVPASGTAAGALLGGHPEGSRRVPRGMKPSRARRLAR